MKTNKTWFRRYLSAALRIGLAMALMGAIALAAAPAGVSPAGVSAQADRPSLDDPADLEAFFDGFINAQLAAYRFPGAQVAVVRGDQVLFVKGYGYADLERRIAVDAARTLFQPGSISKLFTWTAVMQLVEQGRLDLDADVNTYLTGFQVPATFPQPITLRHLMTHTPGFEDQGIGIFQYDPASLLPLADYLAQNVPARVYPPGEVCAYSNYGASLAGHIVAQVTGQSFEQYIAEAILAPLGMARSTFYQPLPADLQPDAAVGYAYASGGFIARPAEYIQPVPAGAMWSTAEDMTRFMIAHLQDGRYGQARILQEATAREMHSHQFSSAPGLSGMALGFIEHQVDAQRLITHSGDTSVFHSLLALDLDHQVGLYVSYNGSGTGSASMDGRSNLLIAFMERYLPVQPAANPAPDPDFTGQAARFAGSYFMARSNHTTPEKILNLVMPIRVSVDRSGELLLSYSVLKIRAVQTGRNEFRQVGGERQRIVFTEDAAGQVTGIALENMPVMYILKTPWHGNPALHIILLIVCLVVFIAGLFAWPRRLRSGGRAPHLALWAGVAVALINLLFLAGVAAAFAQLMAGPVGVPPLLKALMWLPLLTGLLALAMIGMAILAWARRWWNARARLFYTLGAAAGVAFILFVAYWNLWVL